jgi:hypothetical protein
MLVALIVDFGFAGFEPSKNGRICGRFLAMNEQRCRGSVFAQPEQLTITSTTKPARAPKRSLPRSNRRAVGRARCPGGRSSSDAVALVLLWQHGKE